MHGQGMCLIDTAASVKACFVEGSLCVFLHFSAVPGALPKSPWHPMAELGRSCSQRMGGGRRGGCGGRRLSFAFWDPWSWHSRPEHLLNIFSSYPQLGILHFQWGPHCPESQGKWIALSHQQWWLLILLVNALDNFFFRPGRGLSSVAPALSSKTSEIFSSVPALFLSMLSVNSNEILTFLLVDKSSCISYISWDVVTKKI